jgi:peptide/nickel transport system substrate-binding protein
MNSGLANTDNRGLLNPVLADAVPTVENGRWVLLPDGRMETTWHIRPNAYWQDGTPFTADDLIFTTQVSRDKQVGWEYDAAFDAFDSIESSNGGETVIVRWKQPFIEADTMFSHAVSGRTLPLPKHLLEDPYTRDRATLMDHPYWSEQFVGTGPFKLREWQRGSHLIVDANERFVLGRPRIDQVDVRFVTDPRTLAANILAGDIDLTIGRGISLEQATQVRDQWRDGVMDYRVSNWLVAYPQFLDPSPEIIRNVQFRRALVHALDRQQMTDALQAGLGEVAHTYISPDDPAYPDVGPVVPRYDFDPNRAIRMIEDLLYRRDAEGFRTPSGQRLELEVRVGAGEDLTEKAGLAMADYFHRAGIAADATIVPAQRIRDREYAATFPGLYLRGQPTDPARLGRFHSSKVPTPENNYIGDNNPRYRNPEFDVLLERYSMTVAQRPRYQVLSQIVSHIADQVIMIGLFYRVEPTLFANRIKNVAARPPTSTQAWNAHLWDVTS